MSFRSFMPAELTLKRIEQLKPKTFDEALPIVIAELQQHSGGTISKHDMRIHVMECYAFRHGHPPVFRLFDNLALTLSECEFRLSTRQWSVPFDHFIVQVPQGCGFTILDRQSNRLELEAVLYSKHPFDEGRFTAIGVFIGSEITSHGKETLYSSLLMGGDAKSYESIESLIEKSTPMEIDDRPGTRGKDEQGRNMAMVMMRLLIGVSLLATSGDKIVEADILSKDLQRYIEAKRAGNDDRVRALAARCERRRGHIGFMVGREETIRQLYRHNAHDDDGSGEGHQLTFQHLRRAHFRELQSGKIVFIRTTIVRPDLPANDRKVLYKLR